MHWNFDSGFLWKKFTKLDVGCNVKLRVRFKLDFGNFFFDTGKPW